MTEKEIETLANMIVTSIFKRIEEDTKAMNADFVDSLPNNEEQIIELTMLLKHYEGLEDYTHAANVFATIQKLQSGHDEQ